MTKRLFVTGTGTGVGKTFVTSRLAKLACASGARVFAFKPIETGCTLVDEKLVGGDQEILARAAGDWQRDELRNLYCFERPVAPLVAARFEGRTIDLERIQRAFQRGCARAEVVLVEGAGGWRVPINEEADISTLARQLELHVLVVAHAGLGTINHTLLTLEAVRRDGCEVAAVVFSRHPSEDLASACENAAWIATRAKVDVLLSDDLDSCFTWNAASGMELSTSSRFT